MTEVLPFDPVKYRLGKLCPRGHDYQGTGQSLRVNNKAGYCLACNAAVNQRKRAHKRQEGIRMTTSSQRPTEMQGHYKAFLAGAGLMLFFAALLMDAVLLLWGYQVGQWLQHAADQPQPKDGR